jgi:hypothetical protein
MQAEESVGTVRALKQIVQDHRRLFRIKLTEPATKSSCLGETPQKSGMFPSQGSHDITMRQAIRA